MQNRPRRVGVKLPDKTIAPPSTFPGALGRPTRVEPPSVVGPLDLADGVQAQIVQRVVRLAENNELVEFAVGFQIRRAGTDEGFIDVERVDTCHGEVHIDRYFPDGKKTKVFDEIPEAQRKDIDLALKWALGYIWSIQERVAPWL